MKLHEKIYYCRKKAGLSQEELSGRVGVSRQAVSKWETGESVPETGKLAALAAALGVTVDWLLSEDEPEQPRYDYGYGGGQAAGAEGEPEAGGRPKGGSAQDWVDTLPRYLRGFARRWGWLAGVYIALSGLPFVLIGAIAAAVSNRMFSSFGAFDDFRSISGLGGMIEVGGITIPMEGSVTLSNPMAPFAAALIIIGAVLIVSGTVLAVVLKRKSAGK